MRIFINQSETEINGGESLAGILARTLPSTEGVAVAINNRVVPRAQWADTYPTEGTKVTVITAVCGG
ncbi:MAG: sulfur carrier protein ThiS [Muribaculaceae bacterium]|nr:sulfur carrier protein ThiS [Muribaculaceae bacterium]